MEFTGKIISPVSELPLSSQLSKIYHSFYERAVSLKMKLNHCKVNALVRLRSLYTLLKVYKYFLKGCFSSPCKLLGCVNFHKNAWSSFSQIFQIFWTWFPVFLGSIAKSLRLRHLKVSTLRKDEIKVRNYLLYCRERNFQVRN